MFLLRVVVRGQKINRSLGRHVKRLVRPSIHERAYALSSTLQQEFRVAPCETLARQANRPLARPEHSRERAKPFRASTKGLSGFRVRAARGVRARRRGAARRDADGGAAADEAAGFSPDDASPPAFGGTPRPRRRFRVQRRRHIARRTQQSRAKPLGLGVARNHETPRPRAFSRPRAVCAKRHAAGESGQEPPCQGRFCHRCRAFRFALTAPRSRCRAPGLPHMA